MNVLRRVAVGVCGVLVLAAVALLLAFGGAALAAVRLFDFLGTLSNRTSAFPAGAAKESRS